MNTEQQTGRTRHRIQTRLFGKPLLVLQVEINSRGHCTWLDHHPDCVSHQKTDEAAERDLRETMSRIEDRVYPERLSGAAVFTMMRTAVNSYLSKPTIPAPLSVSDDLQAAIDKACEALSNLVKGAENCVENEWGDGDAAEIIPELRMAREVLAKFKSGGAA